MPSNTSEKNLHLLLHTRDPIPTPHTRPFPASLSLCLSAWPCPGEHMDMATAPLPPTSVLCHWLVLFAPTLSAAACLQYSRAKLSWWRISLLADPLLLPTGMFRKSGVCMQRHRVFAQRQINKTPCASSPRLILAALGNCC